MARNPRRRLGGGRRRASTAAPTRPARTTATSRAWRALLAGLPMEVPGATVNRLCGSGLDARGHRGARHPAGEAQLMIAGGVESMSRAPFVMPKAETRLRARQRDLRHHHRLALRQPADEGAVRRRLDARDGRERGRRLRHRARGPGRAWRWRSQQQGAWRRSRPASSTAEIVPVTIPQKKGDPVVVDAGRAPARDHAGGAGASSRASCGPTAR